MTPRKLLALVTSALTAAGSLVACSSSPITDNGGGCGKTPPDRYTVARATLETLPDGGAHDAGALAKGDHIDSETCAAVCADKRYFCSVDAVEGDAVTVACYVECTGRRPAGYRPARAVARDATGEHFARMAALEAASVDAFRRLGRELESHGAPRGLVRGCRRAARDEIRHARATAALARRFGGASANGDAPGASARSLEAMATENAVEGCVRETFGALVAETQARHAKDPLVRAVMKRLARDELRHAALSWSIDGWARGRLDRAARGRVEAAKLAAARELATRRARKVDGALDAIAGLPGPDLEVALAEALAEVVRGAVAS